MSIDAPPGYTKWRTVKFLFNKRKGTEVFRLKKHVVDGNTSQMITLDDFLEHEAIARRT